MQILIRRGLAVLLLISLPARPAATAPGDFDHIFRTECRAIPLAYLRALTKNESNFDPNNATGAAWGLMQVIESDRRFYNRLYRASFTREDLLDPRINVRIVCGLLRFMIRRFTRNHPMAIPRFDWREPRFVALLTFAWNAGFSEAAGVGYVLGVLEQRRIPPDQITIDLVHHYAHELPRASRHLRNARKVSWCKRVVRDYLGRSSHARATR